MKASEYIAALTAMVDEHGDLEIEDEWGNAIDPPEYNSDGDAVFVQSVTIK